MLRCLGQAIWRRANLPFRKQFPRPRMSQAPGEAAFLPEGFHSSVLSPTSLLIPLSFKEGRSISGPFEIKMAVALRVNRRGRKPMHTISHCLSPSHRVGFLDQNPPASHPQAATRRAKGRGEGGKPRMGPDDWGLGRGSGRGEARGAGGARGAAPTEWPSVASRRPRCPRVAPGPPAREDCTYPAWVVPAAGARVPRVRHGADCAAAAAAALPPGPPRNAPRRRRGTRAGAASRSALRSRLSFLRARRAAPRFLCRRRARARFPQVPRTCDPAHSSGVPPCEANGTFQHQYGAPGVLYFFLTRLYSDTFEHFNRLCSSGPPCCKRSAVLRGRSWMY